MLSVLVLTPKSPCSFWFPDNVGVLFSTTFVFIALPESICFTSLDIIVELNVSGLLSIATILSVEVTSPNSFPSLLFWVKLVGPVDVIVVFLLLAESIGSILDEIIVCDNESGDEPAATILSFTIVSPSNPSLFWPPERVVGLTDAIVVFLLLTESIGSTLDEMTDNDNASAEVPVATMLSVVVLIPSNPCSLWFPESVGVLFKITFVLTAFPESICLTLDDIIVKLGKSGIVFAATIDWTDSVFPNNFPSWFNSVKLEGPVDVIVVFLLFAASIGSITEETIVWLSSSGRVPDATIDSSILVSPNSPSFFWPPNNVDGPDDVTVTFLLLTESIGSTTDEITDNDNASAGVRAATIFSDVVLIPSNPCSLWFPESVGVLLSTTFVFIALPESTWLTSLERIVELGESGLVFVATILCVEITSPSNFPSFDFLERLVGPVDVVVLFTALVADVCWTMEATIDSDNASGSVDGTTISSVVTVSPSKPSFFSLIKSNEWYGTVDVVFTPFPTSTCSTCDPVTNNPSGSGCVLGPTVWTITVSKSPRWLYLFVGTSGPGNVS